MRSPFPGMDPFIEACGLWEDLHAALIHEIKYALTPLIPDRYIIRTGERLYRVRRDSSEEEHRETFVDIFEANPELRLKTSIEVLSPSNKRAGPGWDLYQHKRQSLMLGDANLVEIDLLRGGRRMPMLDPWPDSPYALLVARAGQAQRCRTWPVPLQQAIPSIPVPLAARDADVILSLQPLVNAIYLRSRYNRSIDYMAPLTPPLDAETVTWMERLLNAVFRKR